MNFGEVLGSVHSLLRLGCFLLVACDQVPLQVSLGALLVFDGLRIIGTLCGRLAHHGLVLRLILLLLGFDFRDLLIQVGNHHVHHRDDSSTLTSLLCISTKRLWRRGWCHTVLCKRWRWSFIKFRIIKLVHAVLSHINKLFGSVVTRQGLNIIFVLLLPLLGRIRNLLVKRFNTIRKRFDLLRERSNPFLVVS